MAEGGVSSKRLTVLIGALMLLVLVYQVIGRGCTVSSIGFENGVSFACTDAPPEAPRPAASASTMPEPAHSATPAPASALPPADFAGEWRNVDGNTRGLTRLIVSANPAAVRAWGSCHPSDCDWGSAPAVPFRQSVDGGAAAALQAVFKTAFSETTLIVTPTGPGLIGVETLTHFTDKSGRADYSQREQFRRFGS